MKIAITGGTGFVGRHLARRLTAHGHTVVLIARGQDARDPSIRSLPGVTFAPIGLTDVDALAAAFAGCDGVAHLAGINLERGAQTYRSVHVDGTLNVVDAAQRAGVPKIALLSFLRARPDCGSAYHESKWAAEEIVRHSGLDHTILKAGVIYGSGDHMLDHLSHAFYTFPLFALVGLTERPVRPVAVAEVARVLEASLVEGRLPRQTVAVVGPEEIALGEACRRVAAAVDRDPLWIRMPIAFHYGLAWLCERTMRIPLLAYAQVRILSEGIVQPLPFADPLPADLAPRRTFDAVSIRQGLPVAGRFTRRDLRCARATPAPRGF